MSGSLLYLTAVRFKNKLLSLVKKPQNVIVILLLGIALYSSNSGGASVSSAFRNPSELYAIITAVYVFVFVTTAFHGISKGASMFTMSDVNFVFTSPVKSVHALLYGLVSQMGTSLLLGFFILFQYSWMKNSYGITFPFLLLVLLGYALAAFCGQLTAMVIYSLTSSDDKKRSIAKYIIIAVCVGFGAFVVARAVNQKDGESIRKLAGAVSSLPVSFFPVAGWLRTVIAGSFYGESITAIIICAVLCVAYVVIMLLLLVLFRSDYYEDVLQATEASFSAVTAKKEGRVSEAVPSKVKVGKIGIQGGTGAGVIYYKHRKESKRARLFIFDISTMVYMVITVVASFFMKNMNIAFFIAFASYLQMFSICLGRWTKEFSKPYIYLIPESNMKKLYYCLKESILMYLAEAAVTAVLSGIIMGLGLKLTVFAILLRFSVSLIFTASNIFIARFFGSISVKGISILLYILFSMIVTLPSLMAAITAYFLTEEYILPFICFSAVNLIDSVLVFFICRNIFKYSEINNM